MHIVLRHYIFYSHNRRLIQELEGEKRVNSSITWI